MVHLTLLHIIFASQLPCQVSTISPTRVAFSQSFPTIMAVFMELNRSVDSSAVRPVFKSTVQELPGWPLPLLLTNDCPSSTSTSAKSLPVGCIVCNELHRFLVSPFRQISRIMQVCGLQTDHSTCTVQNSYTACNLNVSVMGLLVSVCIERRPCSACTLWHQHCMWWKIAGTRLMQKQFGKLPEPAGHNSLAKHGKGKTVYSDGSATYAVHSCATYVVRGSELFMLSSRTSTKVSKLLSLKKQYTMCSIQARNGYVQ